MGFRPLRLTVETNINKTYRFKLIWSIGERGVAFGAGQQVVTLGVGKYGCACHVVL